MYKNLAGTVHLMLVPNITLTAPKIPRKNCPAIDSASNINEYQVYFLGVKAAGA